MVDLFRRVALAGRTPEEAWFVKRDGEAAMHADIDNGIVNIHFGFAPLKPAEFVIVGIHLKVAEVGD